MKVEYQNVPGWIFEVDEVSMNVFKVCGRDRDGRSIEQVGQDPDLLLQECREAALRMIGGIPKRS